MLRALRGHESMWLHAEAHVMNTPPCSAEPNSSASSAVCTCESNAFSRVRLASLAAAPSAGAAHAWQADTKRCRERDRESATSHTCLLYKRRCHLASSDLIVKEHRLSGSLAGVQAAAHMVT
jgi:hypothetical protein